MNQLTAIYWIKDEARYIPEWIEFHLMQGYDHFILYDNGSTDNVFEITKPYTDAGLLEFRFYPVGLQRAKNFWVSEECCIEQRGKSKWIDFRSLDERVFCPTGRLVTEFLKDYEEFGGVAVAWEEFNSDGHLVRPEGLIIEHYTQTCKDLNHHIKTIVQPEFALGFAGNPHICAYINGKYAVTENKTRVDTAHAPYDYSFQQIKAHHYRTMSWEEFNKKMNAGVLDHGPGQEDRRREQAEDEWSYTHGGLSRWGKTTLDFDNELSIWVQSVRDAIIDRYTHAPHLLKEINH